MNCLLNGTANILFTTPEKLKDTAVYDFLYNASLNKLLKRIVIDECHCVTMWGPEFREDYRDVGSIRNRLSIGDQIPLMAATATLTPAAKRDVINTVFGASDVKVICSTFKRPNISYNVISKTGEDVVALVKGFGDVCGIVYCMARNQTEKLDELLREKGVQSTHYHAGLGDTMRADRQRAWVNGAPKVIVATVALGMGIDKPDVRFVVHASMSLSLENYYQETGRAGRDGEPAKCVLLYDYSDVTKLRRLIEEKKRPMKKRVRELLLLQCMETYCISESRCHRVQLLEYFNERLDKGVCESALCDNCNNKAVPRAYDITLFTKACVAVTMHGLHVANQQGILKTAGLVSILRGTVSDLSKEVRELVPTSFPFWGIYKQLRPECMEKMIRMLISMEYLQEFMFRETENVSVGGNLFIKLNSAARKLQEPEHKVIMFSKTEFLICEQTEALVHTGALSDEEIHYVESIRNTRSYAAAMTAQDMANLIRFCPTTVPDVRRVLGPRDGLKNATCMTIIHSMRNTSAFRHKKTVAESIQRNIDSAPSSDI